MREPDNLALSFDREDLRVTVSDHQGDSGLAQANTRQTEFHSSPIEPRRNIDIINDAMKIRC